MPPGTPAAIVYDADCAFCRWSLGLLLGWDRRRRLRPVALQDPEAERLLAGLPREAQLRSFHLVEPDGPVHSAGAALAPLCRRLPGGTLPAAVAGGLPGLSERAYRLVADRRGPLGRRLPARAVSRASARIQARR